MTSTPLSAIFAARADREDAWARPALVEQDRGDKAHDATHQKNAAGNPPTLAFANIIRGSGTFPPAAGRTSNVNPCTNVIEGERHDERMDAEDRHADPVRRADQQACGEGRSIASHGLAIDTISAGRTPKTEPTEISMPPISATSNCPSATINKAAT